MSGTLYPVADEIVEAFDAAAEIKIAVDGLAEMAMATFGTDSVSQIDMDNTLMVGIDKHETVRRAMPFLMDVWYVCERHALSLGVVYHDAGTLITIKF